ncbi:MAG: hypothetical protein U0869_08575 [Chloroflexota bacterium]
MTPSTTPTARLAAGLALVVAVLAAIGAACGVFLRGDLATTAFTTVRGEVVDTVSAGLYRFNGLTVASEGVGWDAVTLFLVVPALLVALPGVARGSLRARLLVAGLLVYFCYQGLEYAMFLAFGPLFPVYVGTFAMAGCALAALASTFDLRSLAAATDPTFPRRAVAGLGTFMALLLAGMWLPMVLGNLTATVVEPLDGATTLVVQALDLGFLVPLGIFTAVLAWRRAPAGVLLASVVVVKAVAMALAIVAMLVVEAATTGELSAPPIVIFALTAVAAAGIGRRVFRSIHELEPVTAPLPAASRPVAA